MASYTEVSPSGTGAKIFVRARKPGNRCRTPFGSGNVEIYDHDRYFAVTGYSLEGSPETVEDRQQQLERLYAQLFGGAAERQQPNTATDGHVLDSDDELIGRAMSAKNGEKFRRLWAGDTSGYPSHSEADLSLCGYLARAGADRETIDRLLRRSGLRREKWDEREDYRARTVNKAVDGAVVKQSVVLGGVNLQIDHVNTTAAGKIGAQITVLRDDKAVDQFQLTSSLTCRQQAARLMRTYHEDRHSIDEALARLLTIVVQTSRGQKVGDGETVRNITMREVPAVLRPTHRTERGIWCEGRTGEITRSDFIAITPPWLLEKTSSAVNAPTNELAMLRTVKAALEVTWAHLMEILPSITGAELDKDTEAARRFRSALIRLWKMTATFEVARTMEGTGGESVAARASLISRVQSRAKNFLQDKMPPPARTKWGEVQRAFSAWWRPVLLDDGEVFVRLGMNWELVAQIRQELPGVTDQRSLRSLGASFGCIDREPSVPEKAPGGKIRVAVLSLDITKDLLADPTREEI